MLVGNGHTGGQCVKRDTSFCGSSHCRWKKREKGKRLSGKMDWIQWAMDWGTKKLGIGRCSNI